ncbi:hypothetical protein D3C84_684630 [compost metagenome]
MAQAEFADTRGVDQLTAAGEVEQPRGGGGVGALAGQLGQRADTGFDFRQQAVDQRRLADTGLADEHADASVQLRLQLLHPVTVMRRHFQHRVAEGAVYGEQGIQRRRVVFVDQVELVQQQQRLDARMLGRHQIAVDQVGVGLGQRCKHDDDHVDVGRNRLELTTAVRATQLGVARQLRHDHADTLVAGTPDHLIAGHQRRQVGAQVTTEHLAGQIAIEGFDFDLHTEVRDHQAGLFRTQVATLKCLDSRGLAFGGAGSAFALNLFDAPVLTTIELAFGHGCSVSRMQRLGKTAASLARPATGLG